MDWRFGTVPNVRFDLLRWSGLDVSVWQRSALLCRNECSGKDFRETQLGFLRAQPLERPPQTLEFAEASSCYVMILPKGVPQSPSSPSVWASASSSWISTPSKNAINPKPKIGVLSSTPHCDFTTLSFHTFSAPSGGKEWFRLFRASGATKNSQIWCKNWGVTDEVTAQYQCGWKVSGEMVVFQLVIPPTRSWNRERVMVKFYARIIRM